MPQACASEWDSLAQDTDVTAPEVNTSVAGQESQGVVRLSIAP